MVNVKPLNIYAASQNSLVGADKLWQLIRTWWNRGTNPMEINTDRRTGTASGNGDKLHLARPFFMMTGTNVILLFTGCGKIESRSSFQS